MWTLALSSVSLWLASPPFLKPHTVHPWVLAATVPFPWNLSPTALPIFSVAVRCPGSACRDRTGITERCGPNRLNFVSQVCYLLALWAGASGFRFPHRNLLFREMGMKAPHVSLSQWDKASDGLFWFSLGALAIRASNKQSFPTEKELCKKGSHSARW